MPNLIIAQIAVISPVIATSTVAKISQVIELLRWNTIIFSSNYIITQEFAFVKF